jgi:AcrR family transcriptional regulator
MPARGAGKNRKALLEAALVCLAERGYGRTTSRDLAARSGANLSSIVYHYGSKEELLNAALAEGFRRWFAELTAIGPALGTAEPEEILRQVADQLEASFERNRGLARAFVESLAQTEHAPEVRRELAEHYEQYRSAVASLVALATGRDDLGSRALAAGLIAAFDGLLLQWLIDPERTPKAADILLAVSLAAAELSQEAAALP